MKRGNTALKRVVSVASVAAMAIAGAVLAAPAASANAGTALSLTNAIRALPATDAAHITSTPNAANHYTTATAVGTGTVPNLTVGTSAAASSFQVQLPVDTTNGGGLWNPGDEVTVKLGQSTGAAAAVSASKVTFAGIPQASVAAKAASTTGLDSFPAGTPLTPASDVAQLASATLPSAPSVSSDGSTLTIPLPDPTTAAAAGKAAGQVFVLTVSGVSVTVPADVDTTKGAAVTATVSDGTGSDGTTTIAYVNGLNIGANGAGTVKGNVVTLPPIVVKEAASTSLPANFSITVSGTNSGSPLILGGAPTVKTSNGATATLGTIGGTPATTLPVAATGTAGIDSVAISGLTLSNVKPDTEVTVTVNGAVTPAVPGPYAVAAVALAQNSSDNGTTAAKTFSYTPDQFDGASAKFTPGAAANRIAGANRYDTAAQIASQWADDSGWSQNAVVIANGENATNGVDALSANFLAGVVNAPILLTQANTLPKETSAALTKLFKDSTADIKVYVMGKTASVSQDVRDAVKKAITDTAFGSIATVTVVEVAGNDRYETSVKAIDAAKVANIGSYDLGKGFLRTAFLASGQNNADALAASAVSYAAHIPALLTTNADTLPDSVKAAISADGIKQVVILGSTDRVSKAVADGLTDAGVNVIRFAGSDRFDTAVKIANLGFNSPTDGVAKNAGGTVYLANGLGGFADALAAGPLAGTQAASLLTIADSSTLPASSQVFLATNKGDLDEVDALGGTDRVTADALSAAQALIK